jgi:hypothetical protein
LEWGQREGEKPLWLHFLHNLLPFDVLIARMGNLAAHDLTGHKRAVQLHTEPLAELAVIRQGPPDARNWRFEFNTLLDSIVIIMQPQNCILARPDRNGNHLVALLGGSPSPRSINVPEEGC